MSQINHLSRSFELVLLMNCQHSQSQPRPRFRTLAFNRDRGRLMWLPFAMMISHHYLSFVFLSLTLAFIGQAQDIKLSTDIKGVPSRIAFGSCADHEQPQPILRDVVARQPDVFIYLGDNIYGDTEDMEVLKGNTASSGPSQRFKLFVALCPRWLSGTITIMAPMMRGKSIPRNKTAVESSSTFGRCRSKAPGDRILVSITATYFRRTTVPCKLSC